MNHEKGTTGNNCCHLLDILSLVYNNTGVYLHTRNAGPKPHRNKSFYASLKVSETLAIKILTNIIKILKCDWLVYVLRPSITIFYRKFIYISCAYLIFVCHAISKLSSILNKILKLILKLTFNVIIVTRT